MSRSVGKYFEPPDEDHCRAAAAGALLDAIGCCNEWQSTGDQVRAECLKSTMAPAASHCMAYYFNYGDVTVIAENMI